MHKNFTFLLVRSSYLQFLRSRALVLSLLLIFSFLILSPPLKAQNYGLGFYSHDKLKNERTELDLSFERPFRFDESFRVSFDLNFRARAHDQYGYILRMIRNDSENIDIVYKQNLSNGLWYFYLIVEEHTAEIPFTIDQHILFHEWVTFDLTVSYEQETIMLSALDSLKSQVSFSSNKKDEFRIMFGACDFQRFKTRDVPVMNVKDVKIYDKIKIKYHWPLNEVAGVKSKDILNRKTALIRNPDWLKPKHEDWIEVLNTKQNGISQVAVNYEQEIIYIIGKNQVIAFSMFDNSYEVITADKSPELLQGSQAFYNPLDNKIYSYDVDDQSYSSFDLNTKTWKIKNHKKKDATVFLHHNKHFSIKDSSLYIFGGYGQHQYKNSIQKLTLDDHSWEFLETDSEIYEPRYLAASGYKEDTVYILGGYGSPSGDQMLNPKHFSNIIAYSLEAKKVVKKSDFNAPMLDICFSNSLIFDDQSRDYLVLAFPRLADEGFLQLIKGSLDSPEMELMGNKLPYLFHDTKSYSDLFYFERSNKLVAFTSFNENDKVTNVQLHTLLYPPNKMYFEADHQHTSNSLLYLIVIGGILLVSIPISILYIRKKKAKNEDHTTEFVGNEIEETGANEIYGEKNKSSLLFFGGFQVYDKQGDDITGKFTPLLKELFLLIWLHTLKNNKGLSSDRMTEILWFDKSASSARNNKAVNIAKLRTILSEIGNCEVTHKTGYWKIICDDQEVYNDYQEFLKITESKSNLSKQNVERLIRIAEQGAFLLNLNYDWLDDFKSAISETIIETLFSFAKNLDIHSDANLIIHMADCIFSCDSINEEAMILKCKAHFELGAHSLSQSTYSKFCKDYQELYDQEYDKSFTMVTSKPIDELVNF